MGNRGNKKYFKRSKYEIDDIKVKCLYKWLKRPKSCCLLSCLFNSNKWRQLSN